MSGHHAHLYYIPSGIGFADAFVQGVLAQYADNPAALTDCQIVLPSRRACRTIRDTFLRLSGGKALLLPRLVPMGEADEDEIALLSGEDESGMLLNLAPPVSALERQFILARLIEKSGKGQGFDQSLMLAETLGRFLDEAQSEGVDFAKLKDLAPESFAAHWGETLAFLSLLTDHWPHILADLGMSDIAAHRKMLLSAQMTLWQNHPPQTPVIAAGSTGMYPQHRAFLKQIAHLPQGAVVLAGLDTELEEDIFNTLPPDHPQYALKVLLQDIGAERTDVRVWHGVRLGCQPQRLRLLREALRPAEHTESWRDLTAEDIPAQALDRLTRMDAATPQEEAELIALCLREVLEDPQKTAVVVTPDRRLARRVVQAMQRWDVQMDDTAGQPLTETVAGRFFLLLFDAVKQQLAPVALLSLLKHPFMAVVPQADYAAAVLDLDRYILRGPRPDQGVEGLAQALLRAAADIPAAAVERIKHVITELRQILTPLLYVDLAISFSEKVKLYITAAEALVEKKSILWRGTDGEAAAEFFSDLLAAAPHIPFSADRDDYATLRLLMKGVTVRSRHGAHPRLRVQGLIESRLQTADVVILAGLNEGTWPALPPADPWMSRAMRARFGLPSPEKMLGIAAHDFVQAAACGEVILTRSLRVDGAPTVPARWLLRLDAVLKATGLEWPQAPFLQKRAWRLGLDTPVAIQPSQRPAPCPDVALRPRRLSVTKVERWMRDPYQIYAQHVLNLNALDPLDADPGGAERGVFIHAALEKWVKRYPDDIPPDGVEVLLRLGRESLKELRIPSEVEAFWWPRFERIAAGFVEQERAWRLQAKPYRQEMSGSMEYHAPAGIFTISGKADRIDRKQDGGFAIIDYKSGQIPETGDVKRGLSPQLPLEALMLNAGAFADVKGETTDLIYWKVTGSGQNPVERQSLFASADDLQEAIKATSIGVQQLIAQYDDVATPYLSQPRPSKMTSFSDYDYLARVKEWALSADAEAEGDT